MISFLSNFFADPLYYLGYVFALCAGLAFVLFLRGFLSGFGHVLKQDGNVEHMEHYRVRAIWGVLLLTVFFGVWEILRWISSWFGYGSVSEATIVIAVLTFFFLLWRILFGKKGDH